MNRKKQWGVDQSEIAKEFEEDVFPTFSKSELKEFGEYLDKFRVKKTLKMFGEPQEIRVLDTHAALIDFGAMTKWGACTLQLKNGVRRTWKYDQFFDKYEQYCKYQRRVEYAKEKRLEGLDELNAQQPTLTNNEVVIEL